MDIPVPVVEESESEEETMKKVKQKDTIQTGLSDTAEVLCLSFSVVYIFVFLIVISYRHGYERISKMVSH